jgi:ketol-acid reductoisomerase
LSKVNRNMDVFKDPNVSLAPLQGNTVAIIGYGNQGKPQALNLRDSGINVIIGMRDTSAKKADALAEGFKVYDIPQAVQQSQVVILTLPDERMGQIYRESVEPHLKPGSYLGFSHGMGIHAGWVKPGADINVFLLAPKAQGRGVRNRYLEGSGVPGLVAVHQDPSGDTMAVALSYGKAIGCSRTGIIKTTFAHETVSDLFSEQTVLCGGLTQLIKTGYEVLVEAGFPPEVAYFECLYEVKLIADLIQEGGITFMRKKISSTALYGDVSQGQNVIDGHVKETMRQVLQNIQSGAFAEAFQEEVEHGKPLIRERLTQDEFHPIEETGRALRREGIL